MKITNEQNLPYGLVKAVSPEPHNAQGCISATTLIQGIKQILLTQRHWDELVDDVSNRIWAVFGTAVHSLLESEGENDFTEIEMKKKVGSIFVTGKIDNYNMAEGIICDYKTTSVYKVKAEEFNDWFQQGMIYSWLLKKNNLPVAKCRFIAMLKDYSLSEASRNSAYPQKPVYVYEFDVTDARLAKIEEFITTKVSEYEKLIKVPDDEIPACTEQERWAKKSVFAVMKKGRKTAVKLFNLKEDAESYLTDLGKDHFLEYRPGESTRCKSYCLCAKFCNYYNTVEKAAALNMVA